MFYKIKFSINVSWVSRIQDSNWKGLFKKERCIGPLTEVSQLARIHSPECCPLPMRAAGKKQKVLGFSGKGLCCIRSNGATLVGNQHLKCSQTDCSKWLFSGWLTPCLLVTIHKFYKMPYNIIFLSEFIRWGACECRHRPSNASAPALHLECSVEQVVCIQATSMMSVV